MTHRILVIGTSCAGKSTFAQRLASKTSLPCVELDSLFWGPNWTPRANETFRARVADAASSDAWVIDGDYEAVRDILWPRATAVIWLNYGLPTILLRGFCRSLRRGLRGELLWNGNKESLRRSFLSRESILAWIFATHAVRDREYAALRISGVYPQLAWIEFRRARDADTYRARAAERP